MIAPVHSERQAREVRQRFPTSSYDVRLYPITRQGSTIARKLRSMAEPHGYIFCDALRRDLRALADASGSWDVLHLEDVWAGWTGLAFPRHRTVLNFHNLYRIDDAPVPPWSREGAIQLLRHRAEARLARAYPNLLGLTPRLQRHLQQLAPRAHVEVCPFGLDLDGYEYLPSPGPRTPMVTLIGSMHWAPSASAARRLLTSLFPKIKRLVPAARCVIVGWNARTMLAPYLGMPDVDILEDVPDVRPHFARADLLLYAPQRATGMKVKVLEAFAFGVPVVTNAEGVEGIPALDGMHAGISDDDEGLVERAVRLLRDADARERQREAARRLLESHCGPKPTLDRVEEIYAGVLDRAAA
jgi:glycosyltransferase involved in cell wall biosynthesis